MPVCSWHKVVSEHSVCAMPARIAAFLCTNSCCQQSDDDASNDTWWNGEENYLLSKTVWQQQQQHATQNLANKQVTEFSWFL